jgi:trk system potassium uptake protein TrkA
MKKQVAVIGLGRLGIALATTLHTLGHDVLALDVDEKNVQNIASQITHAVQADATNETTLRGLGIGNFDIAIVTTSEIESSVLTTVLLKKLGVGYNCQS